MHVFMMYSMFELIPNKIRFFYRLLKTLESCAKVTLLLYRIFGQILLKMTRRGIILLFIFLLHVFMLELISDQN